MKDTTTVFSDLSKQIKALPAQIAARSALRMAIGKPTVTSIDEYVTKSLK